MMNLTQTRTPNRSVNKYVNSIFQDIKSGKWGIPLSPEHYHPLVRCRAQNEDFEGAEASLMECIDAFPFSSVPPRLFIALLGEYRRYNDFESVWRVYQALKGDGRTLDQRVYELVQDVLVESPKAFLRDHILELQADFDSAKLGTVSKLSLLLSTFLALGEQGEAENAAQKLLKALEGISVTRTAEYRGWDILIRYSLSRKGVAATKELISLAKKQGYRPGSSLLHRIIIDHEYTTSEQLLACEEALSIEADAIAWSLLVHRALALHGVDAAIAIYGESKRRGIPPLAYMLHPIIRTLVGGHLRKTLEWKNLERALVLYEDLRNAARECTRHTDLGSMQQAEDSPASARISSQKTQAARKVWPGPDSMIYDTLLRAIAQLGRTIDPNTSLPVQLANRSTPSNPPDDGATPSDDSSPSQMNLWGLALNLLDDMRQLNVPSTPMSTTAIIILCMRIAPTFGSAFQVYRALVHGDQLRERATLADEFDGGLSSWSGGDRYFNQFELNAMSYENIIRGFCTLKPKHEGGVLTYPPADLYLQLVKDMQLAGYRITEDVYMTFLYRLGRQARALRLWEKETFPYSEDEVEGGEDIEALDPKNIDSDTFLDTRQSILHSIRTMHNHIVLNAGITPSIDLLNAMLDAYNKVAAVHDAFKVWDTIFLSRIYNQQSVAIIMDTCGWARVGHKASQIWNQLVQVDFPFNKNDWDSRVECLCRVGKLDEALKVVCLEMPLQNKVNLSQMPEEDAPDVSVDDQSPPSRIARNARREAQRKERDVMPDAKTLAVLFSFASKTNQVDEVRNRVRRYLPQVWQSIPVKLKKVWTHELSSNGEEGVEVS